jgi:hypothetical protein
MRHCTLTLWAVVFQSPVRFPLECATVTTPPPMRVMVVSKLSPPWKAVSLRIVSAPADLELPAYAYTQVDDIPFGTHVMPYMIPYYQSGILVTFRCTDCDWTYNVHNPATVPRDEEEKAKEQYVAHCCSEFSSKTAKK